MDSREKAALLAEQEGSGLSVRLLPGHADLIRSDFTVGGLKPSAPGSRKLLLHRTPAPYWKQPLRKSLLR